MESFREAEKTYGLESPDLLLEENGENFELFSMPKLSDPPMFDFTLKPGFQLEEPSLKEITTSETPKTKSVLSQEKLESFSLTTPIKNLNPKPTSKSKTRKDTAHKSAMRYLKQYFKNIFKKNNPKIVRMRFVNCPPAELFREMEATLGDLFPEESQSSDLVHYTLGITGILPWEQLDCSPSLKKEVKTFVE